MNYPHQGGAADSGLLSTIVGEVASAKNVDPLELPPLADTFDPDALDKFVTSLDPTETDIFDGLEFGYAGYRVSIRPDGGVDVSPREEDRDTAL